MRLQSTNSNGGGTGVAASDMHRLTLIGPLILGGLYPNHTTTNSFFTNPSRHLPPYFYSGMLQHGYVGCMQDVEINGQQVNLTYHARRDTVLGVSTGITDATSSSSSSSAVVTSLAAPVCSPMPNQCEIGHCLNDGVCNEGWNRFVCDCSATGFNGPICNQRKFAKKKRLFLK